LCHLLAGGRIPPTLVIPSSPGKHLEPGSGPGYLRLTRHERRAAQHPGQAEELLASRRCLSGHELLEPIEALSGFERKEIRGTEWVGH
jgi:hypothetical protein